MQKNHLQGLRSLLRVLERELYFQNNASCCNGVTMAQCHTLLEVEKKPAITITQLSNHLILDKSTVSRTVDGLVNIGLLDRAIPENNRRTATINLTDKGKAMCDTINYNNDAYLEKAMHNLTDEEKDQLVRLFSKLATNMVDMRKGTL